MDIPLTLSLVILAIPLAGFILQMLLAPSTRRHVLKEIREDEHTIDVTPPEWSRGQQKRAYMTSWISTGLVGIAFVASVVVAFITPGGSGENGTGLSEISALWFNFGDIATSPIGRAYTVTLGILNDRLAATMLIVVTLVSFLVHLFSSEYMRAPSMHAGRLNRYYAFLGLFTFSMLGIVLANNLLMIYIFWELVGVSSYLLIGFWHERPGPQYASRKAFIVNRVGDIGMFAGIMILYAAYGTFELTPIFEAIAAGQLPFGSQEWLTAAGILLFCGAVGKSAQVPLNVWLPDAMEGPTPVSALIHAATMVAAGVYLTARIFPLLTGGAMMTIAVVGAATALIAATIALVQWDIKKVLAFSTVSQLGYMILALGVGAWKAAVFHLVTHAAFKACLFLGAGSAIHAMHHAMEHAGDHHSDPQDMRNMGGLGKAMPWTFRTTLIATLAISGVPLFSGFMSKDEILAGAWAFGNVTGSLLADAVAVVGFVVAGMTAFYMVRMLLLTFGGAPRRPDLVSHAHENRAVMTLPLVVLAVLSLWIPFGANPIDPSSGWFLSSWLSAPAAVVPADAAPVPPEGGKAFPVLLEEAVHGLHAGGIPHVISLPALVSLAVASCGILLAWVGYGRRRANPDVEWSEYSGLRRFLFRRWYQDELYERVFPVAFTQYVSRVIAWFDRNVVDGVINGIGWFGEWWGRFTGAFDRLVVDGAVNGAAGGTQFLGLLLRTLQTGKIQTYVLYVVVGVAAIFFLTLFVR